MKKHLHKIQKFIFIFTMFLNILNIVSFFMFSKHIHFTDFLFRTVQFVGMFLVLSMPSLLKKYFKFDIPFELYILIAVFSFSALVLGDVLNFYAKYPWWDSVLHFLSGVILSFIGLWLIHILMGNLSHMIYLNKAFVSIFIIFFSLGMGAIWELVEYTGDGLFGLNTQQYMATTDGSIVGKKDVPLVGHEALSDSMKDLALDLGGAILVAGYGFIKNDTLEKNTKIDKA